MLEGSMENWNDLKLVLAIRRAESLAGGAKVLGVNHSTAFRRLNALEESLGVRLFERMPSGTYLATPAGERMATTAELLETETASLDRDIVGQDHRLTGQLRVTSSETLAYRVLTGELARFRAAHPGIVVELLVDNRILNLSRREADVALRVARPREPELFGRKLADVAWAVYGTAEVAAQEGAPYIGWSIEANAVASAEWVHRNIAQDAIAYRTTSLVNQLAAARAGMGLAVLPCYLGDPEPGLVRALPGPIAELTSELWIVTHADLKRTARIRAFLEVVGEGLAAQRPLFAGETAG
jgi:DNA-binding transcriptional LysR family regulator